MRERRADLLTRAEPTRDHAAEALTAVRAHGPLHGSLALRADDLASRTEKYALFWRGKKWESDNHRWFSAWAALYRRTARRLRTAERLRRFWCAPQTPRTDP